MYSKIKTNNILKLAFPEIATQLVIVVATLIEMFNVAKLGVVAIAAMSIGNMVTMTINSFLGEVDMGARVLAARFLGAGDNSSLLKTFVVSIYVPAILGCAVVLFSQNISFLAFYLIGDNSLNQVGILYLSTLLKSVPFALIFFSLNGFIAGIGDTFSPFYIRLIMHSFEICLGYILMFGYFGLPKLGVHGVAIALVFTYMLGMLLCLVVILYKKFALYNIKFALFKQVFFENEIVLKSYISLSFDLGLQFGFSDIALYLFVIFVGWHGISAVAVYQIAYCQVFSSMQLPLYGFYTAASIIMGQILGENKILWAMPAANKILKIALILSTVMAAIVFGLSSFIGQLFSPLDANVAATSALAIKILSLNIILDTFYIVVSGSLIGAYESHFVMQLGLAVEYLLLLPACYILSIQFGFGFVGACVALCIRSSINCLIVGWRFFVVRKWDSARITFRRRKIFAIQSSTIAGRPVYDQKGLVFAMNDFLEEGVIIPVKFLKNKFDSLQ
ncbi:MAG: MATE efflux family protein [candidate division TM6 bacterium GW2011_GWF2_37_49]|nr:MAG: MATE efflux family protein [candidate division TM6 bacterium GW2011_GWF2_37_49]